MASPKMQTCVFLTLVALGAALVAPKLAKHEPSQGMYASTEDETFFPYTNCHADDPIGETKNIMLDETKRWPKGVIPYVLDSSFNQEKYLSPIKEGMKQITDNSCITFVERSNEQNYIRITDVQGGGCKSSLGMRGGEQIVNLESGGCTNHITSAHEFLHAAGFFHEHSRSDRDKFITVNMTNIREGSRYDWRLCTDCSSFELPYDYHSIMHYPARGGPLVDKSLPSMWSNDPNNPIPEKIQPDLEFVTQIDAAKIKIMYKDCK